MTWSVVALAGRIGSGKTSVAVALAHRLGWRRVGFGDHVRAEAARQGLDPGNREVLQSLGEDLLQRDLDGFCRAVLAQAGGAAEDGLVVDGVRHVAVLDALHRLLHPAPVRLIYLAAGDEARRLRLAADGRWDADMMARAEVHSTEADLKAALPGRADIIIDADRDFDAVLADALDHVQTTLPVPKR